MTLTALPSTLERPAQPAFGLRSVARAGFAILAIGVLCGAYMLLHLGGYGLLDNNEGLYAAIAAEMAKGGSWIVPHAGGYAYVEKPPLLYWLGALSMGFFGATEWAVRLVPAVAALGTVLLVGVATATRADRTTGIRAALVLGTCAGWIVLGRTVGFDTLLTFFLAGSMLAWHAYATGARRAILRLAYAMLAFAVLAKGFVALALAWLIIGGFILCERMRGTPIPSAFDAWGLGIFASIAAPWHFLAIVEQPGFAWWYLVNEHVLRFLGLREPHDYYSGGLFYYVPRLWAIGFPWIIVTPFLARRASPPSDKRSCASLDRFCVIWMLVVLAFYTLSRAKANYYAIQAMPAVAILIALRLPALWRGGRRRQTLAIATLLLTVGVLAAAAIWIFHQGIRIGPIAAEDARAPVALACAGSAVIAAVAAIGLARRSGHLAIGALALMCAPLLAAAVHVLATHSTTVSSQDAADYASKRFPAATVGLYGHFSDHTALAFYLPRLVLYDTTSPDLAFARRRIPALEPMDVTNEFGGPEAPRILFVDVRDVPVVSDVLAHGGYERVRAFSRLVMFETSNQSTGRIEQRGPSASVRHRENDRAMSAH